MTSIAVNVSSDDDALDTVSKSMVGSNDGTNAENIDTPVMAHMDAIDKADHRNAFPLLPDLMYLPAIPMDTAANNGTIQSTGFSLKFTNRSGYQMNVTMEAA